MKDIFVVGVDPSSTRSGVALLKNGEVIWHGHHESDKKLDIGERLYDFGIYLHRKRAKRKITALGVEKDSVNRNMNTVRMLSYFESAALSFAGELGAQTFSFTPNSARKLALGKGNGNLKKQQVYDIMCKEYDLPEYDSGGSDESDAIVIGKATWLKLNES